MRELDLKNGIITHLSVNLKIKKFRLSAFKFKKGFKKAIKMIYFDSHKIK